MTNQVMNDWKALAAVLDEGKAQVPRHLASLEPRINTLFVAMDDSGTVHGMPDAYGGESVFPWESLKDARAGAYGTIYQLTPVEE